MNLRRLFGLRSRLLVATTLPALLMVALLLMLFIDRYVQELEQACLDRGEAVARQLAPGVEFAMFTGASEVMQRLTSGAKLADAAITTVTVLDANGRVLSHAGPKEKSYPPLSAQRSLMRAGNTLLLGLPITQSRLLGDASLEIFDAPASAPVLLGHIVLNLDCVALEARKRELIQLSALVALFGFLVSGWFSVRIARTVARPIQVLTDAVTRIGRGEAGVRVPERDGAVLARLEVGINDMAAKIELHNEQMLLRIDEATDALRREKEYAERMARTDVLTGLKNRRAFDEDAQQEIRRSVRHGAPLSLVLIDIDHFKRINDIHGHQFGDQALVRVAAALNESIRAIDLAGRWGGEEFAILMPDTTIAAAMQVAERIRVSLENTLLCEGGKECTLTASFGVAQLAPARADMDDLLSAADSALYRAKNDGRNRVAAAQ